MKLIIALLNWSNDLGNKVHLMTRTSYEHLLDGKTAPRKIVSQQIPTWVRVSVESNLLGEGGAISRVPNILNFLKIGFVFPGL